MYDHIIIDTNNLFARNNFIANKEEQKSQDVINKTIYLTFKMILKLKETYLSSNGTIHVLADNPTSKLVMRKHLDDQYKANRIKESDGYYRGIDYLLLLCSYYSEQFETCRIKIMEADDLVPSIIKTLEPNSKTLLVSRDMDWATNMSQNTDWLDKDILYTQESFKKKYKFIPNEHTVTLYKVLLGCTSDNIPAIKDITEQVALNIVSNFNDIFEVLECIQNKTEKADVLSDFVKNVLITNKQRLLTNHNLVYFNFVDESTIKQATIKGSFNPKALQILYKLFDFPVNFDTRIESASVSFGDIFSFDEAKRK